jgi:hypothetical protein
MTLTAPGGAESLILVPAAKLARILRQQGDETVLGLSDYTTITGAEFLNDIMPDHGLEAALSHPQKGPMSLCRTERFANRKQRGLARATGERPTCGTWLSCVDTTII